MGCVFGREVVSREAKEEKRGDENEEKKRNKNLSVESRKPLEVGAAGYNNGNGEAKGDGTQKEEEKVDGDQRLRSEKRRSRLNPRPSNPRKHRHGEQVAAGWPAWLSAVVGEAIDGWLPRRADSFEKIAKVKCYMNQLLSGLEHCHKRGVLHRDIKGSNLLLDNEGILKIADFGLATVVDPNHKRPMTSRVVTLWYRAPELLLGATNYGVGIDLWSAGCILAELLFGRPIMPGRTEVEQLHKIYKLCGSPSDEYWKKSKLPNATIFKPQAPYKRRISETFKGFPTSSLPLIETLLAIDPAERRTATDALSSEFFATEPYACDPSSLPQYPPSKEMDAKRRDEEARKLRVGSKAQGDGSKKTRSRDRAVRAVPAPEANAELQSNIDRQRLITRANAKSKSEKFPPPHQDGGLGIPLGASHHIDPSFVPSDVPFSSTLFTYSKEPVQNWSGPLVDPVSAGAPRRKKDAAAMHKNRKKLQQATKDNN